MWYFQRVRIANLRVTQNTWRPWETTREEGSLTEPKMFTSQGNHTLRLLSYYTSKFFSSYSHVFCIHNYTCTIMSYLCDYLKLKKNSISHEQKFKTTYTVLKSSNKIRAYWAPQFYKKSVDDCWQTLRYLSWRLFKGGFACCL